MNWRNSKWFVYGWLPIRVAAAGLGYAALAVLVLSVYLMWFRSSDACRVWRAF